MMVENLIMEASTEFNKKIAEDILSDLKRAKNLELSFVDLEEYISAKLGGLDSTFPAHLKEILKKIPRKIHDHRQNQYAATLNTDDEGTYDESLPLDGLFDFEIESLQRYIDNKQIIVNKTFSYYIKYFSINALKFCIFLLVLMLLTNRCIERLNRKYSLRSGRTTIFDFAISNGTTLEQLQIALDGKKKVFKGSYLQAS